MEQTANLVRRAKRILDIIRLRVLSRPKSAACLNLRASGMLYAVSVDISIVGGVILLVWSGVFLQLAEQKKALVSDTRDDLTNLSLASEESVARAIANIDQAMRFIRMAAEEDPGHFDIRPWAEQAKSTNGIAFQFGIDAPNGDVIQTTTPSPSPEKVNLHDREHFRFHLNNPDDLMFISKPVRGRVSNRMSIQFTRKLIGKNGQFDGVLVVSVDPAWLTKLDVDLALGRGSLFLLGDDGIIRCGDNYDSKTTDIVGKSVPGTAWMKTIKENPGGYFRAADFLDNVDRIYAFRRIGNYPLAVVVSRDASSVFAAYRKYKERYMIAASCLSFVALMVGVLLLRGKYRLVLSERTLSATVDNISQGLVMSDARKRVPIMNRRAHELLDIPKKDDSKQHSLDEIMSVLENASQFSVIGNEEDNKAPQNCLEFARHDGIVLELRDHALPDGGKVMTFTDVTERKENEERIRHIAHHDSLTGLPNRLLLQSYLSKALHHASLFSKKLAVLMLDLDGFKNVNDTFGHDAGDLLLRKVADRLRSCVRQTDIVARLGGDEFVIIQTETSQQEAVSALCERIISLLSQPFDLNGHQANIGTSIGVSLYPSDGADADTLMKNADTALYRSKRSGRGTYRLSGDVVAHPENN